jgi:hypothetical protein
MYDDPKKIVTVRVKCLTSEDHVNKNIVVHVNEHGFFELPDYLCPVCFLLLDTSVDVRSAK